MFSQNMSFGIREKTKNENHLFTKQVFNLFTKQVFKVLEKGGTQKLLENRNPFKINFSFLFLSINTL